MTHLNWQKISAYSGGMPLACSTVTRKVKMLPTSSWPARSSPRLSLVSATLPSLRSAESHRGGFGGALRFIQSDLRLCAVSICIWILSSRLVPEHYRSLWFVGKLCSSKPLYTFLYKLRKTCTSLISITIHSKCIQRDHLPSLFPTGRRGRNLRVARWSPGSRTHVIDSVELLWGCDDLWTLTLTLYDAQLFQGQAGAGHNGGGKVILSR